MIIHLGTLLKHFSDDYFWLKLDAFYLSSCLMMLASVEICVFSDFLLSILAIGLKNFDIVVNLTKGLAFSKYFDDDEDSPLLLLTNVSLTKLLLFVGTLACMEAL